ncbi:aminoglycoside phosphotransferase family protein [Cohnella lubricantis]|uniref:Aminoglycoside phosphotransferase family protein n=1 Tax=Cohnella lubricantis TaxID=2163172 RepID=A0A841TG62_9BACL|nr:aminoglycoside phosphotransferase family protein [Cohnella lubricantis]MBB6679095.1 aminoglycoside phosphotransferase family protein [Cohnella lubricantis]MBP2119663.1 aminoglycoside phosphotransferase (APT) family kinase protein [Cohnella lubricantis]
MKEEWERTQPPVTLDLRQIEEIVQPAFPGKRAVFAERIGVGLSNSNYKVLLEGSDTPLVVRIYRRERETAEKELAIAGLVRGTVPIAGFLYADASCKHYPQPWAVLEWKEGVLLSEVMRSGTSDEKASAAASAGSVLAAIHSYPMAESGFFGADLRVTERFPMNGERFLGFMEQCLSQSPFRQWLGEELARELWSFCIRHHSALSESREAPVLVHSDYNGLNILMRQRQGSGAGDWEVSAVLDWEDAFAWNRYADIANMLRYEKDGSAFERHFIRAYQERGIVLESNWKLLSRLEDLVALCDMLSHSTEDTPKRISDLRRLIARTIQSPR